MIPMYEKFHNVKYNRDIVEDIVRLSSRFIFDKSQPAAALDLLDECGSYIKNQISNTSEQIVQLQQKIDGIQKQKLESVEGYNFEDALKLKRKETLLSNKLKKEITKQKAVEFDRVITDDIVRDILSIKTNIPISNIKGSSLPDLHKVQTSLKEKYISQSRAITSLLDHFKRVKTGLQDPLRPLGSFLFIGPTGVGKTYLCELISEHFFYNKQNFLKIDMSEFMEPHSVSKLIGSPPGYVGYGDRSIICDFIKNNPYSLLLLDEIEKAHIDVINIFLQVLDKGELTDSVGRKINFKNCIIVFTSNIGSELFDKDAIGFGGSALSSIDLENACQQFFKPEFLNRLDEIIRFEHLSKKDIYNLVQIQLQLFADKVQQTNKIEFILTDDARDYIAQQGYSRKYGARFLRRFFEKHIETEIASLLIKSKTQLKKITCKLKDNKLIFV
tara:strand:+ start:1 stop:1329 length:1329 start_codon:yes stop_codon:yes gene_type:complete